MSYPSQKTPWYKGQLIQNKQVIHLQQLCLWYSAKRLNSIHSI